MKSFKSVENNRNVRLIDRDEMGSIVCRYKGLLIVASNAFGWEHVSVSTSMRMPTWEEMCKVKDLFWEDDETVVQYHPKKTEYINNHPFCLHLWKKSGESFELPPVGLIGVKKNKYAGPMIKR